jgi:hypothetical protein
VPSPSENSLEIVGFVMQCAVMFPTNRRIVAGIFQMLEKCSDECFYSSLPRSSRMCVAIRDRPFRARRYRELPSTRRVLLHFALGRLRLYKEINSAQVALNLSGRILKPASQQWGGLFGGPVRDTNVPIHSIRITWKAYENLFAAGMRRRGRRRRFASSTRINCQ